MNAQICAGRIASAALIIGFFVLWELALPRVRRQGHRAAAALADPRRRCVSALPAIWPHAVQTLYTTLVGFALGIVSGVADRRAGRLVAARLRRRLSAADRLLEHPEGRGGADLRAVVRRRHGARGPHRDDPVHLPDRGERRDRARHHRARARGRHARAQGEQARHPLQRRPAAHACRISSPR